jgi:hypothetical protein
MASNMSLPDILSIEESIYVVIWDKYYKDFEKAFDAKNNLNYKKSGLPSDYINLLPKKTRSWNRIIAKYGIRYSLKGIKVIDKNKFTIAYMKYSHLIEAE